MLETDRELVGASVQVHSINGSIVFKGQISEQRTHIPLDASAATYLITIDHGPQRLAGKILVK